MYLSKVFVLHYYPPLLTGNNLALLNSIQQLAGRRLSRYQHLGLRCGPVAASASTLTSDKRRVARDEWQAALIRLSRCRLSVRRLFIFTLAEPTAAPFNHSSTCHSVGQNSELTRMYNRDVFPVEANFMCSLSLGT